MLEEEQESRNAPSHPGAIAHKIVQDCGLANVLGQSVCLSCANMVLAQDNMKHATLYCRALYRDLEVAITQCTDLTTTAEE